MFHRGSQGADVSGSKSNYALRVLPDSPRKRRIAKVVVGGGVALTAVVVTYLVTLGLVGVATVAFPRTVRFTIGDSDVSSDVSTDVSNVKFRFTIGDTNVSNVSNVSTAAEIQSSLRGAQSAKPAKPAQSAKPAKPSGVGWDWVNVHEFLHSSDPDRCSQTHVLKGENQKEPDVHICLDHIVRGKCVVYSMGIANNWIFDDFMIKRGCKVFSFDPSMDVGIHKRHVNHLFEPVGIGAITGKHVGKSTLYGGRKNYPIETLKHIMDRHGHTFLNIVRMDVEGAEWPVLRQWMKEGWFESIGQLLLEIHMRGNSGKTFDILQGVASGHRLFHTARNMWNNDFIHGDMSRVYEVGWIRNVRPHCIATVMIDDKSGTTSDYKYMTEINHRRWADAHGYVYHTLTQTLTDRNVRWNSIKFTQQLLKECASVFFTDADSIFLTDADPIHEFITGSADFVYAGDRNYMMNAGQFWIRDTEWGRGFLRSVWNEFPKRDPTCAGNDNAAFNVVLSGNRCSWAHVNSQKCVRKSPLEPRVRCVPQNAINAYAPPPPGVWRLHVPGIQARKLGVLQSYVSPFFVHIPKTGGTSLQKSNSGTCLWANQEFALGTRMGLQFTILRNPTEHVISMFKHCKCSRIPKKGFEKLSLSQWLQTAVETKRGYIRKPLGSKHCYNPWNVQSTHLLDFNTTRFFCNVQDAHRWLSTRGCTQTKLKHITHGTDTCERIELTESIREHIRELTVDDYKLWNKHCGSDVRVLDAVHINHEVDVYALRHAEYQGIVDEFHVFEGSVTQRGELKNSTIRDVLPPWVHYHRIPKPPNYALCRSGSWSCEKHDRAYVADTMARLVGPNDVFITSDVDEVTSAGCLRDAIQIKNGCVSLNTPVWKYSFNWKDPRSSDWRTLKVCSGVDTTAVITDRYGTYKTMPGVCGWHMSTFGSIPEIRRKASSIIEGVNRLYDTNETTRRVTRGIALYGNNIHFTAEHPKRWPRIQGQRPRWFKEHFLLYPGNVDT